MIGGVHKAFAEYQIGSECRDAVDFVVSVIVVFSFQRAQIGHVGINSERRKTEIQFCLCTGNFQTTRVDVFRRRWIRTRVIDDDICQSVIEEVNVVRKMPVVNLSHEVKLDGIHKFRHKVFTAACSVGVVMAIEIGRIHKGA